MVKRTAEITLEGETFRVHAFNMKELQEVGEVLVKVNGSSPVSTGYELLKIAMRRAEPACDFDNLEPLATEISAATTAILKLAGLEPKEDPQTAAPAN